MPTPIVLGLVAVGWYLGLVLGSLALLVLGLATIVEGFEQYDQYSAIHDLPVASLDSIALGRAAVRGTARPDGSTETIPIGEQPDALVYDLRVMDTNKATEGYHVDERVGSPFFLEGDGHRIRVDPADLTLDLSEERTWSVEIASHDQIPQDMAAFATERDLPDQGLDRDREFEYEYVAPGDDLFVYGRAVPDEDRDPAWEKPVLLTADDRIGGFVSDKSRETLLTERRGSHRKQFLLGAVESVVGLGAFLWLSGLAQLLLGA